jgi:ElaB/YqjD/DUF883 family membrane-anchored ribosome-binding protein
MKNSIETPTSPKALLTDLESLAADARSIVTDPKVEAGSECLANLREKFSAVQERFSQVYDSARKNVVAGARSTDATIRENPYAALAIALGIGLGLGVLLGRRSAR